MAPDLKLIRIWDVLIGGLAAYAVVFWLALNPCVLLIWIYQKRAEDRIRADRIRAWREFFG